MKVKLIVQKRGVNPDYSVRLHRAAKAAGTEYDVPPYVYFEPGTVLDGPLVWGMCCPGHMNAPPEAIPDDEECRVKVVDWMEKKRPAAIAQIRLLAQPQNLKNMKPESRQHVLALMEAYEGESTETPAAVTEPPVVDVPEIEVETTETE